MSSPEWRFEGGRWLLEGEEGFTARLELNRTPRGASAGELHCVWEWEVEDANGDTMADGEAETFEEARTDAANALRSSEEWFLLNGDRP